MEDDEGPPAALFGDRARNASSACSDTVDADDPVRPTQKPRCGGVGSAAVLVHLDGGQDGQAGELFGDHRSETFGAFLVSMIGSRAEEQRHATLHLPRHAPKHQPRRSPRHAVVDADVGRPGCLQHVRGDGDDA